VGTEFVLFLEDNDDLRETVVELISVALKRRCVGSAATKKSSPWGTSVGV
jgi:hypothetical protein